LVELEVVLANGEFIKADKCSNPDIFWAFRGGGGGSFGVVTSITYKLWQDKPIVDLTMGQMGSVCSMAPLDSIFNLLAKDTNPKPDFTSCGDMPGSEGAWNSVLKQTHAKYGIDDTTASCLLGKFQNLCGRWAKFITDDVYIGIDDRWGTNAQSTIQFRGTIEEAHESFVYKLDNFWSFPGNTSILDAYGVNLRYAMKQFDNYYDYRLRSGQVAPFGPQENYTYAESGVCPNAGSPGKCLSKLLQDMTHQEGIEITIPQMTEPHTTGIMYANYPQPGYNAAGSTGVMGCSRVFDMTNATQYAFWTNMPSPLGGILTGMVLQFSNYWIGGKIANVARDATAIGPSQRDGQFYVTWPMASCPTVITSLKQARIEVGTAYNHYGGFWEPNFEELTWGSNSDRLWEIKKKVDPQHRFSAKGTFGFLPACDTLQHDQILTCMENKKTTGASSGYNGASCPVNA
jgi:hypothetical protein